MVLPSVSFVFEGGPASVLKGRDNKVGDELSSITALSKGRSSVILNVTGTKGFYSNSPYIPLLVPLCHDG